MNAYGLLLPLFISAFCSCDKEKENPAVPPAGYMYDSVPVARPIQPMIRETSGIADSRKNKGHLWVQEDSGNPTVLHLVKHDGQLVKSVFLKGVTNRDWEDLQLSGDQLYLADIGDNARQYSIYTIYRFDEPAQTADTVEQVEAIRFRYPDGAHDAEAFLVDGATKDIYIITKNDKPSLIFKLAFPYSLTQINNVTEVGKLSFTGVVSAALAPSGREIILKTYPGLHHFPRSAGQSIPEALSATYKLLPYRIEPQGEAVGFRLDGDGFFTLSEKGFGSTVNLYYYPRK